MDRSDMDESTHGRRDTAKAQGKMALGKPFLNFAIAIAQRKTIYLVSTAVNIAN